jgi:hypothetical protein
MPIELLEHFYPGGLLVSTNLDTLRQENYSPPSLRQFYLNYIFGNYTLVLMTIEADSKNRPYFNYFLEISCENCSKPEPATSGLRDADKNSHKHLFALHLWT